MNRQALAGAFVSGLAHDLNNPLQVVTGTVELLLARTDLPPDVRARLERIAQQVNKAGATLLDIVGFVRERPGTPGQVDLRSIAERVLGLRRYPLTRAQIAVVTEFTPMGQATVMGRAPELAQALLNLIVNAEAALAGRPDAELRVSVERGAETVRLRVQDNGPGVPADIAERVFQPFVSSREPEKAAGIGLTAAAALVARNGGVLRLEPPAAGAAFVIEMPPAV